MGRVGRITTAVKTFLGEKGETYLGTKPYQPIGTIKENDTGFVSVTTSTTGRGANWSSGGGGGGSSPTATPTPTETRQLENIQRARETGRINDVQRVRENAIRARLVRETARLRNIKLTTPARQLTFINRLNRESQQQPSFRRLTPQEVIQQNINRYAETRQSVKTIRKPINIFSPKSFGELGVALKNFSPKSFGELGVELKNLKGGKIQKVLSQPLLFTSKFVSRTGELKELPASLLTLIKNPKNIKNIPSSIKADFKDTIQLLRTSKSEGLGKIGSDIFTFKFIGGSLKLTGKVSSNVAVRLNPKFVGVARTGARLNVKGVGSKKIVSLKVVGRIPKESISSQIGRAGTRVSAISSQADTLVGLIRRKKLLRKPIPNENKFPTATRNLLKKFDKGKITARQLVRLDKLIKKRGAKGILERSFFADPNLRIRPSRLGVLPEKEATFRELLSGKATLRTQKPQILLFENIKISKFPKSLKSVANKLKRGGTLTSSETNKLLLFQQRVSGKFKPLGFVTRESEITLSPNEIIKRIKKVGITRINGRNVPIISTKVIKPTRITGNLLRKARTGKATARDLKQLSRKLKKETGFDYSTSSLKRVKKYYPLKRKLSSSVLSKISRRNKGTSFPKSKIKYTSRGSPYKPYKITPSGKRFVPPSYSPPKYYKSISTPTPKYPPNYPPPKPPFRYPPKYINKKRKWSRTKPILSRSKSKPVPVFNVYGKSGKKFIRLNKKPLTRMDALSRGTFAVDRTTSAQFFIKPTKRIKKSGKLLRAEKNYYNRMGYKLREYKIKGGRKFGLKDRYIERTKHKIDTPTEKSQLSLSRFLRGKVSTGRTRVKRSGSAINFLKNRRRTSATRISPARRKVMLFNLKRARRTLKQNRIERRKKKRWK